MKKTYFVDSENVGDSWISLLATVASEDEIIVFYTMKSPHMNYKNLVLLKNSPKEVTFIECCEGNNALDFQLSTDLGFRMNNIDTDDEFIIVSNDTGFDAIVKFWNNRNKNIRRISNACCTQEKQSDIPLTDVPVIEAVVASIDEDAKEILFCLGKDDLPMLFNALCKIYGEKRGKCIYNAFKSDTAYSNYLAKHKNMSKDEKQELYCSILFSQKKITKPSDFTVYIMQTWKKKKNLNSLRSSLQARYGNSNFTKYYELVRDHMRILEKIK